MAGGDGDRQAENRAKQEAAKKAAATAATAATGAAPVEQDPYGTSGIANQSVRRRGATDQTRVGSDTRVREDASSGTSGAAGSEIGQAMSQAAGTQQAPAASSGGLWQGTRQPTDLASIQQRVLQSILNPTQRGQ